MEKRSGSVSHRNGRGCRHHSHRQGESSRGGKCHPHKYTHQGIPSHRLSNYLKFLHELAAKGSTTAHLFSTAVISGSASVPNLKEMMPPPIVEGTGN